eukprot:58427-Pleurochrysis_carterae.AAC.2
MHPDLWLPDAHADCTLCPPCGEGHASSDHTLACIGRAQQMSLSRACASRAPMRVSASRALGGRARVPAWDGKLWQVGLA